MSWGYIVNIKENMMSNNEMLIGSWSTNIGNCVRVESFFPDGSVRIENSLGKIMIGEYVLKKINQSQYQLSYKIMDDNGFMNCQGLTTNFTGSQGISYVIFEKYAAVMLSTDSPTSYPPRIWIKQQQNISNTYASMPYIPAPQALPQYVPESFASKPYIPKITSAYSDFLSEVQNYINDKKNHIASETSNLYHESQQNKETAETQFSPEVLNIISIAKANHDRQKQERLLKEHIEQEYIKEEILQEEILKEHVEQEYLKEEVFQSELVQENINQEYLNQELYQDNVDQYYLEQDTYDEY